jgi:hypothetical protein
VSYDPSLIWYVDLCPTCGARFDTFTGGPRFCAAHARDEYAHAYAPSTDADEDETPTRSELEAKSEHHDKLTLALLAAMEGVEKGRLTLREFHDRVAGAVQEYGTDAEESAT